MLPVSPVEASSDIADGKLMRFYEYWAVKRAGRRVPARCDIHPAEITELLGYLNILDVQDEPRDFRVRLNGSANAEMLGRDVTGALCSALFSGAEIERCKTAFNRCVDEFMPVMVETTLAFCGKPYMRQEVLVLPFSSDGQRVDAIVTAHSYHPADRGRDTATRH